MQEIGLGMRNLGRYGLGFAVNPKKLETGLRPIGAGVPFT